MYGRCSNLMAPNVFPTFCLSKSIFKYRNVHQKAVNYYYRRLLHVALQTVLDKNISGLLSAVVHYCRCNWPNFLHVIRMPFPSNCSFVRLNSIVFLYVFSVYLQFISIFAFTVMFYLKKATKKKKQKIFFFQHFVCCLQIKDLCWSICI